jgi:hypothetical protein
MITARDQYYAPEVLIGRIEYLYEVGEIDGRDTARAVAEVRRGVVPDLLDCSTLGELPHRAALTLDCPADRTVLRYHVATRED